MKRLILLILLTLATVSMGHDWALCIQGQSALMTNLPSDVCVFDTWSTDVEQFRREEHGIPSFGDATLKFPILYHLPSGFWVSNVQSIVSAKTNCAEIKTTYQANLNELSPEVLKAVVAAIVKSVNARFPATNKITAAEIRANIKDALP